MTSAEPPAAASADRADGPSLVATFQVSTPEPFCFARPEEWPKWIRRFERFRVASGLVSRGEEAQVNTLIYAMGDQADDILRSFTLSEEDRKNYTAVKGMFDSHFVQRRNVIFERAKFNRRRQEEGESVEAFITALYTLAEHCGYGGLHDEMVRDRIVVGIRNSKLSEKLQLDPDLTLASAITQVRQSEAVKLQQSVIRGKPDTPVGAVQRGKGGLRPNKGSRNSGDSSHKSGKDSCPRCGRYPAHEKAQCPAKDQICRSCNKRGHFRVVCRSGAKVRGIETGTDTTESVFMGTLSDGRSSNSPWTITLTLEGKPVVMHIDTGAEVTVISQQMWRSVGRPELLPIDRTLRGPDQRVIPTIGKFTGTFTVGVQQSEEDIYVAKGLSKSLLGQPSISSLGLIKRVATVDGSNPLSPKDQFPSLFRGLGRLEGEYTIELRDDARPYALTTPRRVAIPLLKSVRQELNRMEELGVIAKVNQPTEWCAGMVVVPKANSQVRICVDLTRLNLSVKRERHPLPAVDQTLALLAGAKVFTKLDANSGFWQIPLAPASSLLTTFITPFGRYCFHRLPFGISSAPEHFQRRMSEALSGMTGTVCMMDDILVHGRTREEHDDRLREVLQRLSDLGMTLNSEKCLFAQSSVKFLGHVIDSQGIRPDPNKVSAIEHFSRPTNVSDVRRFLGMVNQLSKFSPNLADMTQPMRELLVKENAWAWGDAQEKAFGSVKRALAASPVLALFDPNLETVLSADASNHGLGAVLLQRQLTSDLQPVAFISRSMTPTETRYAQIEKEALAFTWACERLADYLVGMEFHIQTDHKPLVPLFSSKHMEELPLRVQRFRMRMMRFQFTISHIPGKNLIIADALSRAPVSTPTRADEVLQQETTLYVNSVIDSLSAPEARLQEIKQHQEADEACQQIVQFCQSGWPAKSSLSSEVKPYFPLSAELSVEDNLLLRGGRIVIPPSLRKTYLDRIHNSHLGISKCRERARQSVWWPGISKQLEELIQNCHKCLKAQKQRSQPLTPTPLPTLPWQKVASDLFEWKGATYLLVVDYFSRYIEIARLDRTTTADVVTHLKSIFARHGIPEILISDNGPQYSSREFQDFAEEYEFRHITSSPYFPQGNGEAERAVATIKNLLKKGDDPYKSLLAYRSTPLKLGYSPSQLLMGRILRTTVPTTRAQREPCIPDLSLVRSRDKTNKARQKKNFDSHHGARELSPLLPGDQVWVPQRECEGEVQEEVTPRSYTVETEDGSVRRNRRDLIRLPNCESSESSQQTESNVDQETQQSESNTTPEVRRSSRTSRPPERLDPSWSD